MMRVYTSGCTMRIFKLTGSDGRRAEKASGRVVSVCSATTTPQMHTVSPIRTCLRRFKSETRLLGSPKVACALTAQSSLQQTACKTALHGPRPTLDRTSLLITSQSQLPTVFAPRGPPPLDSSATTSHTSVASAAAPGNGARERRAGRSPGAQQGHWHHQKAQGRRHRAPTLCAARSSSKQVHHKVASM